MHVCPAERINVLMNKVIVTVEKFSEKSSNSQQKATRQDGLTYVAAFMLLCSLWKCGLLQWRVCMPKQLI